MCTFIVPVCIMSWSLEKRYRLHGRTLSDVDTTSVLNTHDEVFQYNFSSCLAVVLRLFCGCFAVVFAVVSRMCKLKIQIFSLRGVTDVSDRRYSRWPVPSEGQTVSDDVPCVDNAYNICSILIEHLLRSLVYHRPIYALPFDLWTRVIESYTWEPV